MSYSDAFIGSGSASAAVAPAGSALPDSKASFEKFIQVYENGFPDELVDLLTSDITNFDQKNNSLPTSNESYRRCTILPFPRLERPDSYIHFEKIKDVLKSLFARYKQDISETGGHGTLHFCNLIELPNIIMYKPNEDKDKKEHFHAHSDSWSLDSCSRQVSIIVYLNDVEEGGETIFSYGNIRVKPKKGSVLFFPSHFTFTHRGEAPISGPKQIMGFWLHFGNGNTLSSDPNRKTFYRTLPF